jgi:hypothetical protein
MGRQIQIALSYDDEQNLVDELRKDGFVVVPERLPTPRLWEHVWEKLPPDDEADTWDYQCAILPAILARTRHAHFVGSPSAGETRRRGSIPSRLAYSIHVTQYPSIEWIRNRRIRPRTLRYPGGGGRFYVYTQGDYGSDEQWMEAVVGEYEKIVRLIKKWTVSRGRWGYWSKNLDPPPSDDEYQRLMESTKVSREQRKVCDRFGVKPWPVSRDFRVGVARNVKPDSLFVHGLRQPPEGETTGWYVWAGEERPTEPGFFSQLHLNHLLEWCPKTWRYLALPPGWRFRIAPDAEDVWYDPSLLQPEGGGRDE